jgi:hypothetical protein
MEFDEEAAGDEGQAGQEFYFGMNEEEVRQLRELKDSVIFLVDCRKSMHEKNTNNENDEASLSMVFKVAASFMKTKIITSENDTMGIVLYNCKKSENSLNF